MATQDPADNKSDHRARNRLIPRVALAIAVASLAAGCATCREHPVICSVAIATVATSIALSVQGQPSNNSERRIARMKVQP